MSCSFPPLLEPMSVSDSTAYFISRYVCACVHMRTCECWLFSALGSILHHLRSALCPGRWPLCRHHPGSHTFRRCVEFVQCEASTGAWSTAKEKDWGLPSPPAISSVSELQLGCWLSLPITTALAGIPSSGSLCLKGPRQYCSLLLFHKM